MSEISLSLSKDFEYLNVQFQILIKILGKFYVNLNKLFLTMSVNSLSRDFREYGNIVLVVL